MGPIRRNVLLAATGVACIAGGGELGNLLAHGDDPYKDGSTVEQYADCAHALEIAAPRAKLPPDCVELVVWKHPERHGGAVYPDTYNLSAQRYAVDPSGFAYAKEQAAKNRSLDIEGLISAGVIIWLIGVFAVYDSSAARKEEQKTR
jgi:hypothetical protein